MRRGMGPPGLFLDPSSAMSRGSTARITGKALRFLRFFCRRPGPHECRLRDPAPSVCRWVSVQAVWRKWARPGRLGALNAKEYIYDRNQTAARNNARLPTSTTGCRSHSDCDDRSRSWSRCLNPAHTLWPPRGWAKSHPCRRWLAAIPPTREILQRHLHPGGSPNLELPMVAPQDPRGVRPTPERTDCD